MTWHPAHLLRPLSLVLLVVSAEGCTKQQATRADCDTIFDRIVEIELRETGYRDEALLTRRRAELRRRHQARIDACVGRPLRPGAMRCVAEAETTEALSHDCLD